MKKSIPAGTIVVALLTIAILVALPSSALADTWTYTGLGGATGAILSLTYGGGNLYAGMTDGHVWRNNGDNTWTDIGKPGNTNPAVYSLSWGLYEKGDQSFVNGLYAGVGSGDIYVYFSGSWNWTGTASSGSAITALVDVGGQGYNVYAGSSNGKGYRYRGVAGSTYWDQALDTGSSITSLSYGSNYISAACTNGHVWHGYGVSGWQDFGQIAAGNTNVFVAYHSPVGICAAGSGSTAYHFMSLGPPPVWNSMGFLGGWNVTAMCSTGTTLYAGNGFGSVWVYAGGTTWNDAGEPWGGVHPVTALATDGTNLYVGYDNGHVSKYNGSWTDIWPDSGAQVNALIYAGAGNGLYAGCQNGQVYIWEAGGWGNIGNNIGSPVYSLAADSSNQYAGCADGQVYYNNVGTWTGLAGPGSAALALVFNGTRLYAGCADGHLRYYNGVWNDLGDLGGGQVNALTVSDGIVDAGTNTGQVYSFDGTTVSSMGLDTGGNATLSLCFDGQKIFAGTANGHVFIYSNSSWSDTFPPGTGAVNSLSVTDHSVYEASGTGQVFRYKGGTEWILRSSIGAGSPPLKALAWSGTNLWAGGQAGIYRGTLDVPPSLTTDAATSITGTGATLNGNLTGTGGANVDSRGFRYRKVGASAWADWTQIDPFTPGTYTHPITGLDTGTDYEYQASAHNWTGWAYGATVGFHTLPKPVVDSVSPTSGAAGSQVSITGSNFGASKGSSTVTVGGVGAQVVSWSDTKIVAIVPGGTQGGAVVVTTAQGGSNTDKTFTVNATLSTWYLAEGTNAWGFNTYISIENPNNEALHAKLTYMDPNAPASGKGVAATRTITLPALSQTSVSSVSDIGAVDFSTKVECLEGKTIAVDRTMFWTGPGYSPSQSGYHSSIGTTAPSKTWYLPEGSSNWGFETWTLVENPNPGVAHVTLTYMTATQGAKGVSKTVPGYSRATYSMASDIGAADSSIQVSSDMPVIAERSMYENNRREGSCSIGATTPAADYFLAEGATGYNVGFITYILVQNPNNTTNNVTLTYQTPSGQVKGPTFTMQPDSRRTVRVNDQLSANTNVSTSVHGSKPLVAERAMYWDNGTGTAFHASIGLPSPHMSFYLPDGQTSAGWETWTLVQNPNPGSVTVRITYLPQGGGTPITFTDEISANSRSTYSMADKIPSGRASIMVHSLDGARPVMVERSMYMNNRGGGADTIGGFTDK